MTDDEIAEFIERSRTATMATLLPDGRPHLVAMWYAVVDGEIWFETKAKSQKAVNLRRDPTITVMIDDGQSYTTEAAGQLKKGGRPQVCFEAGYLNGRLTWN